MKQASANRDPDQDEYGKVEVKNMGIASRFAMLQDWLEGFPSKLLTGVL